MSAFTPNFMADDELQRLLSERNAGAGRRKRRQASTSGVGQDCRAPVDSSIGERHGMIDCLYKFERDGSCLNLLVINLF